MLFLKQDKFRGRRIFKDPLEMHCVKDLIFGLDDFLEGKVVVTVSQGVEVYVSIVLPIKC